MHDKLKTHMPKQFLGQAPGKKKLRVRKYKRETYSFNFKLICSPSLREIKKRSMPHTFPFGNYVFSIVQNNKREHVTLNAHIYVSLLHL